MQDGSNSAATSPDIGVGFYTVPEAARLLRVPASKIRRWLGGSVYRNDLGKRHHVPPLWTPQLPASELGIELNFRDLIELRFVAAFLSAGVSFAHVRACIQDARDAIGDRHPFSTQRFRTDGKSIFWQSATHVGPPVPAEDASTSRNAEPRLLDMRKRQFVFHDIIARTFRDLDIEQGIVARWRPYHGKSSIVVDPARSFGQPITMRGGVPTAVLKYAIAAEGSADRVAFLYGVQKAEIRDAISFESELAGS